MNALPRLDVRRLITLLIVCQLIFIGVKFTGIVMKQRGVKN